MTENSQLDFALGQLRHAYQQLKTPGAVGLNIGGLTTFAEGLIAPQIRILEAVQAQLTAAEARTTALEAETHAKDIAYTHDIRVERLNVAKAEAESAALRLAHADLLARAKALTWKLVVEFAFDESQAELRLLNEAIAKASHVAGSYGAQPEVRPTPVWDEGT